MVIAKRALKNHQRQAPHRCALSMREAQRRGHTAIVTEVLISRARRLRSVGYTEEFSYVEKHYGGGPGKRSKVVARIQTSPGMVHLLGYMLATDDRPDLSLAAAIAAHEVYGDDAARIILSVLVRSFKSTRGDSDLKPWEPIVTVLRANGCPYPLLALRNLMFHIIDAAASNQPGEDHEREAA